MPLIDSLICCTQLRKESLSLRICHWKIPKWKTEEKKKGKKKLWNRISRNGGTTQKVKSRYTGIPEEEERGQKKYWKQ